MCCRKTRMTMLALLCCPFIGATVSAAENPTTAVVDYPPLPVAQLPAELAEMMRDTYDPKLSDFLVDRQCEVDCPVGGRLSVEPNCGPDYVDVTNGGCNSTPPVFETIACGDTVCGTAGTFTSTVPPTTRRDTDWYRFSVPGPTIVRWTARAEFSLQTIVSWNASPSGDCPAQTLLSQPPLTSSPAIPPCTTATVRAWVPAGTYYAFIAPRTGTGAAPCDAEYTATLTCDPVTTPCDISCAPGATVSTEPDCGEDYIDLTDGGCNTTPTAFGRVNCGETVCGKLGVYLFAGTVRRDLDWYRLTLTVTSTVTIDIEADTPPVVTLANLVGTPPSFDPCQATTVEAEPDAGDVGADPCTVLTFSAIAQPGEYILIVTSRYFAQFIQCGATDYNLTVTCAPVSVPCEPLACPPGGQVSDEPNCGPGYIDEYNPGCNGTPPCLSDPDPETGVPGDPTGDDCFESAACGDVICGRVGTYPRDGSSFRDLDWYEIITTAPCTVRARVTGTFPIQLLLVDGNNGCPAPPATAADTAPPCEEALATATLLPGTYWISVGPQGFGGVSCADADYVLAIECECSAACEVTCPPGRQSENEPDCGPDYVDTTNPGCNGTPERFIDVACPSLQICGTSGTFLRSGSPFRDTDWFRFTLAEERRVTWRMRAEFPAFVRFVDLNSGCPGTTVADPGVVTVPLCTDTDLTACLQPGTWAVQVFPQAFTGIPCGSVWIADMTCAPCSGPACTAAQRGDADNSGAVDFNDINCFVPALVSLVAWEGCPQVTPISGLANYTCRNDVNCSGAVDFDDIGPFVSCLVGGACPVVPPCTP